MSGTHSDSHIPYICSVHVPATAKSSRITEQPIKSADAINGFPVFSFRPAITGSTKYGPNLKIDVYFNYL